MATVSLEPSSPPEDPRRRPPRSVALLLVLAALLGAGLTVGLLAAVGALDGGSSATTVIRTSAGSTEADALDPRLLYANAVPGIVSITTNKTVQTPGPFGPERRQATATGSGFIVDRTGHIVTAQHVVRGATRVSVKLQDATSRTAVVLGEDDATDVAVIRIDTSGLALHPLELARSSDLRIGDPVAAIGDPFHLERSISTGIVSGLDRTMEAPNGFTVAHTIQTDAALNPGNSGGPLLSAAGTVIGVVDQIATNGPADQSSGVGFVIPSDVVRSELDDLIAGRDVRHAFLGVTTSDAAGTTAGAVVVDVAKDGPAERAGVRTGDVVTALGGTPLKGTAALVAGVADHQPGDRVPVALRRGSSTVTVSVVLGTQPKQRTNR